jgi:hypothetical protein
MAGFIHIEVVLRFCTIFTRLGYPGNMFSIFPAGVLGFEDIDS